MASQGNARKLKNGLTQKQNTFKNKLLKQLRNGEQLNGTQAALEVYETTDKNTAHVIAHENLQNHTIQQQIEVELERQGWNSSENLKEIIGIARSEPKFVPAGIKLRANIELMKLTGKYPGQTERNNKQNGNTTIINLTYNEAKERLSQLNSLAADFIQDAEAV